MAPCGMYVPVLSCHQTGQLDLVFRLLCITQPSSLLKNSLIIGFLMNCSLTLGCSRSSRHQARGVRQLSSGLIKALLKLPSIGLRCFDFVVLCQKALLILLQRPWHRLLHALLQHRACW